MHVMPRRVLVDHFHAVILADEVPAPVHMVIDRETGWPVAMVPRQILDASDVCLWVPQDDPGSLQISVIPEEIDRSVHAAMLTWEGHHGLLQGNVGRDGDGREGVVACQLRVQWGRCAGNMHEASNIALPHPFAKGERAILRAANAHPDLIDRLASALAASVQTGARMVGVDEWGVSIRSRAGLMRASFDEPRLNEEDARVATVSLLNAQDF
jgi:hypothetical protein